MKGAKTDAPKEAATPTHKGGVVRVDLSGQLHETLEEFQRVHKILHGNKISKEQIIINMLEMPQLLETLEAMKKEAKDKI